jgi:hypothetical protein
VKQDKQITEIVESLYDIGTVTAVYEIFGGFNNRSFGIEALKMGAPRPIFCANTNLAFRPGKFASSMP